MGQWTTEDNDAAEAVDVTACRACGDKRVTFVRAGRDEQAQAICLGCGCCGPIKDSPVDAMNAWDAMWRNAGESTRRVLAALAEYVGDDLDSCVNVDPGAGPGGRSMLERSTIAAALRECGMGPTGIERVDAP